MDENSDITIDNLYAFQKYLSEVFFNEIGDLSPSIKVASLRFSRVIGSSLSKRKSEGFFVRVVESLMNNNIVEIPHPNNKINLIDIRDAVGAINFIINKSELEHLSSLINVGGTNISIKEYCDTVINCLGVPSKKDCIRCSNNLEITTSSMLNSSLLKNLGWEQNFTLKETISDIINDFEEVEKTHHTS